MMEIDVIMEQHHTTEQSLLHDSMEKFIRGFDPGGSHLARDRAHFDAERLRKAADMGLLGLLVPESLNGTGRSLGELAIVLRQLGRGLVRQPIGLAACSAAALCQEPLMISTLEKAVTGTALIVPAMEESPFGDDPLGPKVQAGIKNENVILNGTKMFVCAEGATGFLVNAQDGKRSRLYYVDCASLECGITKVPTVGNLYLAKISLVDTPAIPISDHSASENLVESLYNLVLFTLSAELLGIMEKAQEITLEFLRTRRQFGKSIGSFQAVQHMAVNMFIRLETTRSLVLHIADNSSPFSINAGWAAAVKAKASEDALVVTRTCVQLHGAMGFTDECSIGHYLKRAALLSSLFGNASAQRRRYTKIAS